jgi:hypothetical protein
MHLLVIVKCNAWTLPQEWYKREWAVEKEMWLVWGAFAVLGECNSI